MKCFFKKADKNLAIITPLTEKPLGCSLFLIQNIANLLSAPMSKNISE